MLSRHSHTIPSLAESTSVGGNEVSGNCIWACYSAAQKLTEVVYFCSAFKLLLHKTYCQNLHPWRGPTPSGPKVFLLPANP